MTRLQGAILFCRNFNGAHDGIKLIGAPAVTLASGERTTFESGPDGFKGPFGRSIFVSFTTEYDFTSPRGYEVTPESHAAVSRDDMKNAGFAFNYSTPMPRKGPATTSATKPFKGPKSRKDRGL